MSRTETKQDKEDLKENGNGDYKPANPAGKTVHIEQLKDMKMAELTKLARDMDIQGASALKKQDLMNRDIQSFHATPFFHPRKRCNKNLSTAKE